MSDKHKDRNIFLNKYGKQEKSTLTNYLNGFNVNTVQFLGRSLIETCEDVRNFMGGRSNDAYGFFEAKSDIDYISLRMKQWTRKTKTSTAFDNIVWCLCDVIINMWEKEEFENKFHNNLLKWVMESSSLNGTDFRTPSCDFKEKDLTPHKANLDSELSKPVWAVIINSDDCYVRLDFTTAVEVQSVTGGVIVSNKTIERIMRNNEK